MSADRDLVATVIHRHQPTPTGPIMGTLDGKWYARCRGCGWTSPAATHRSDAQEAVELHRADRVLAALTGKATCPSCGAGGWDQRTAEERVGERCDDPWHAPSDGESDA